MPGSTYSTNLKVELMATGENSGTWGDITNTNLGTALEQAIVGYGNPDYVSDANLTISITNSNAAQAARALVLNVTSSLSLTATRELVVPTIQKQYIVQNNTTGSQSITVKTSAGTGITVPNGRKAHLYVNGTDVIQMFDFVDINGGAIDGTPIGASSASTGAFTTLNASGATTLDGNVTLGNASGDNVTVTGTITSNLLFTDNTYDIGASGATRPRNLFLAGAATIGGNLSVGGTLTLTGGVNLNGNVTVGDNSSDTLTINSTITSNLLFTDNTYDIGASGATRPRNLFLAGNATVGGNQTLTGALTVDSTTDSSSTTTGSIQTDGGLGVAKALYVGTTANIAGNVTLSGGTANGVLYLNGSKVATSGSALTFDGATLSINNGVASASVSLTGTYVGSGTVAFINFQRVGGAVAGTLGYDDANNAIRFGTTTNHSTIFLQNNAEAMRLTSTGLGIGTNNPLSKLTVQSQASSTVSVRTTDAVFGTVTGGTALDSLDASYAALTPFGIRGSTLTFGTSAGISGTFDSSGNLGIGTSSPITKLDVRGGYITAGTASSVNGTKVLGGYYTNGNIATWGTEYSNGSPVMGYGVWPSTSASGAFVSSTGITVARGAYSIVGNQHFWYSGGAQTVAVDGAVSTSVIGKFDDSGNFLVGTTNNYAVGAANWVMSKSGYVFAADNTGSANNRNWLISPNGSAAGSLDFVDSSANNTWPNNAYRMSITRNGYVGINDINPTTLLSLASGTATTLGLSITPSGWNNAKHRLTVPTQGDLSVWSFNYSGSAVDYSGYATSSISVGQAYIAFAAGATNTAPVTIATIQPSGLNFPTPSSGNANIDYTATAMTLMVNSSSAALRFGTNSAERARFDSSGDFMIGTTSSSGRLTVVNSAGAQAALFSCGSGTTQQAVATFSNTTNGGYLSIAGVGTSSAVGTWTNGSMVVEGVPYSSGNTFIGSYTGDLVFQNNRVNSGRFTSAGNFVVGADTASGGTQRGWVFLRNWFGAGDDALIIGHASAASGDPYMAFNYNGSAIGTITQNGTTAVAYNTSSDYRLKNVTGPVTTSGSYIDSLKPVEGTWKSDGSTFVGLIAHEVQEVSRTQIATGVKDGERMQGMDYSNSEFIANIIAELQSLRKRVAQLEQGV